MSPPGQGSHCPKLQAIYVLPHPPTGHISLVIGWDRINIPISDMTLPAHYIPESSRWQGKAVKSPTSGTQNSPKIITSCSTSCRGAKTTFTYLTVYLGGCYTSNPYFSFPRPSFLFLLYLCLALCVKGSLFSTYSFLKSFAAALPPVLQTPLNQIFEAQLL